MNKVILIGRLTKDPEIRYSQAAEPMAIARYTLAVNRRFKREGEADADFINCVSFGKQAEFTERFFKKGMQIAITGRLSIRTYDDPNSGQRKWMTEVNVDEQEFTESKAAFEARSSGFAGNVEQRPPSGAGGAYEPHPSYSANSAPPPKPQSKPQSQYVANNFEPTDSFSNLADGIDDDD
ncbi:MAG: single-stranded DNA-binding protein, partial [Clostridiales bacterium]|nr:single-stranded DNA-binding protein [Clostridiales bacterium]